MNPLLKKFQKGSNSRPVELMLAYLEDRPHLTREIEEIMGIEQFLLSKEYFSILESQLQMGLPPWEAEEIAYRTIVPGAEERP
jgi:hypothetical protein